MPQKSLKTYFEKYQNLGAETLQSDMDKLTLKVFTTLCLLGGAIFFVYFLVQLFNNRYWEWSLNLIGSSFMLFPLIFYAFKKSRYLSIALCYIVPLFLLFIILYSGYTRGRQYYFFFLSCLPILYSVKIKHIILPWLLNLFCFAFIEICIGFSIIPTINPEMSSLPYFLLFYGNMLCIFLLLFIITSFYRKEMNRYYDQATESNKRLSEINDKLIHSEERYKESSQTKDKFLSILAHDLKNPISIIYSLSHLLTDQFDDLDDDYKRKIAHTIKDAVDSSNELINDMLQWARTQTQNLNLKMEKVNLYLSANKTLEYLKPLFLQKNLTLEINIDPDHLVSADRNGLMMILNNLVTNAVKFNVPNGAVVIDSEDIGGNKISLTVRDTGIGLTQEEQNKLFKLGADLSTVGKTNKGTGLGLLLCKEFAEAMNGQIDVKSIPGNGSAFTVVLLKYQEKPIMEMASPDYE